MNVVESDLRGAELLELAARRYRGRMRAAHLSAAKHLRTRAASAMSGSAQDRETGLGPQGGSAVPKADAR